MRARIAQAVVLAEAGGAFDGPAAEAELRRALSVHGELERVSFEEVRDSTHANSPARLAPPN